jgi:3-deoxy-7-phosphoheptulonate synthase
MIESNLEAGNQKMTPSGRDLQYGVSVTDACISWNKTQETLAAMAQTIRGALLNR